MCKLALILLHMTDSFLYYFRQNLMKRRYFQRAQKEQFYKHFPENRIVFGFTTLWDPRT